VSGGREIARASDGSRRVDARSSFRVCFCCVVCLIDERVRTFLCVRVSRPSCARLASLASIARASRRSLPGASLAASLTRGLASCRPPRVDSRRPRRVARSRARSPNPPRRRPSRSRVLSPPARITRRPCSAFARLDKPSSWRTGR